MTTLTDEDYIKGLQAKEADLLKERDEAKQIVESCEKRLSVIRTAIEGFKEFSQPKIEEQFHSKFIMPTNYSEAKTWNLKVLYATKLIGGGFVDDIRDKLVELDSTLEREKTRNIVTQVASHLKGIGELRFEAIGIKYKYYVRE